MSEKNSGGRPMTEQELIDYDLVTMVVAEHASQYPWDQGEPVIVKMNGSKWIVGVPVEIDLR